MAIVQHGGTLPDLSQKTDFYAVVDNSSVTNIVNADISANAGIVGSKLASLNTITSGAGVIPAANLTSVAQKGANSDITSISGLTTALSIAQGGTGQTTAQLAINALAGAVTNNRVLRTDGTNVTVAQVGLTTDVTGTLPVGNGGTGATAAANAADGVVVLNASAQLPAVSGALLTNIPAPGSGTITSAMLKTTSGEVSSASAANELLTLPGGTYGFYPQIKSSGAGTLAATICGCQSLLIAPGTTYVTTIWFIRNSATASAQQRYVTASGEDHWIFLLIDKETKDILSAYQAPDHPSYGNGGDYDKVSHPFLSYNNETQEIILVDKETTNLIKSRATDNKSILDIVNEDMVVNYDEEKIYIPLHSGKFINSDGLQIKHMVENLPPDIKVKALVAITDKEKLVRDNKRKLLFSLKEQKHDNKLVALKKKLNITDEEIKLLSGH